MGQGERFISPCDDGVLTPCAVNLDNIQTIPKRRTGALLTGVSPEHMVEVERGLAFALGLA